ncbi:MAG: TetR/AcrR family transcriptional regulator [Pseudomonadota bacterium]
MAAKPKKVKTRDRILQVALQLFNEEGEAQVSTVDIAGVLDISPGNLYYHFKGKEAIIEALFDDFEEEIRQVLNAPINRPLAIDDNWIFVYIVFEEINDFRFFYAAMSSILERCPDLRGRFSRLLAMKTNTADAVLKSLEDEGMLDFSPKEREALASRLAAHMTFWLQFAAFQAPEKAGRRLINDGVHSLMMQIAPYVQGDRAAYIALLEEYFRKQR